MVARVNSLLIQVKNQGSEHILTISLLKKVFRKHFKIIHKFTDTANEFIKLFSL